MKSDLQNLQKIMRKEKLSEIVINTFSNYYEKVVSGFSGKLSENEINPPSSENLVDYQSLQDENDSNLKKLAVIKLNGGLGTSMGLTKAKSLLPVKNGLSFLDIIAKQILYTRQKTGYDIPLLFMNSFNTSNDTLSALQDYPSLKLKSLPLEFLQNKFPKIRISDLKFLNDSNSKLNWNPPGHGDIYMSLANTGLIDKLLENGIEYFFISNSDNLGAVTDIKILNYFADKQIPFMMEVCKRTESDKKGGHLAETKDGQLILRESAQCPDDEIEHFQNIDKYSFFNTNNLWINLNALKKKLSENNNMLLLPIILNQKEVNGTKVYQIETAMGAAISVFENSQAMIVPRSRFAPVKKTNDLLAIWSDAYSLDESYQIKLISDVSPVINLDSEFYKTIDQLQNRIKSVPSLIDCKYLSVQGDITFDENVVIKNSVTITAEKPKIIKNKTYE